MAETRALKRLARNVEKIQNTVLKYNTSTGINEIKTCLAMLADEWQEFQSLEKYLKGEFEAGNEACVAKLEASHFELKQILILLQNECEGYKDNPGNSTIDELVLNQTNFLQEICSNKRDNEVRLPRVNIPSFDGKYAEFASFRDLFEASIHDKPNISKVHKLQYLKGLLKGEAYSLINHLTITDAHYDEAWAKVKARYDKRKHVVNSLIRQFMDQPNLTQGSSSSIRRITDISDEVLRGLKVLGKQGEGRDPWLIYLLINKLDDESKRAWAHETAEIDFPTLEQLFKFLNKRCDELESLSSMQRCKTNVPKKLNSLVAQYKPIKCPLCANEHHVGQCESFLSMQVSERKQYVINNNLCFNCLSPTHQSKICRSKYNCRICKRKHHTTIHLELEDTNQKESTVDASDNKDLTKTTEDKSVSQPETSVYSTFMRAKRVQPGNQAILPTACVYIRDRNGNIQKCRVLLDSGSQTTFISENCVKRLQLMRKRANVHVTGTTNGSIKTSGRTDIYILQ